MTQDKEPQQIIGTNDWRDYRIYILESLKQSSDIAKMLATQIDQLDERVRNLENRMYMAMGALSFAMFLFELYRTFIK